MSILIWMITLLLKRKWSYYRYQQVPPAKMWGMHVIVDPTWVVLFKILMTWIIPMVRAAIIKYAPGAYQVGY